MSEEEKRLPRGKDYHGCRNCENQIEPLRGCEWLEHGGDGTVHLICPMCGTRMDKDETD